MKDDEQVTGLIEMANHSKIKVFGKPSTRQGRIFALFINILNLGLVLLAVFIGYRTVEKLRNAQRPPAPFALAVEDNGRLENISTAASPRELSAYRAIWERNLFNVSSNAPAQTAQNDKSIDLASVEAAGENIGLTLLGTVAADMEADRFAVIQSAKGQDILQEGQDADGFIIKKILRNSVIIATAEGDKLLAITFGGSGFRSSDGNELTAIALSSPEDTKRVSRKAAGGRFRSVELPFDELAAGLNNVDDLILEVGTLPYSRFGKHAGFRIESVPNGSILSKIGLRSRDAVLAINDVPIQDESEAYAFFEKIAEGEKVYIKYRRRARTRTIELVPI
jgi:type II secretion system protein C